MPNTIPNNTLLATFLRNLATNVEQHSLTPEQEQRIGEFFMNYNFLEQINNSQTNSEGNEKMAEDDFLKFICLGWYVYSQIEK